MSRPVLIPTLAAVAALSMAGAASAQTTTQDRLGQVLNAFIGQATSMDAQWGRNQRPLSTGSAQFQTRLDTDVRAGTLTAAGATRLRADYDAVVALEERYGADSRFTAEERADLNNRYGAITQSLAEGGPRDATASAVADGRADFDARLNTAVNARRLTRTAASQLRADYDAVIQTETTYARDGISTQERADLDARLDALDARVGDGPAGAAPVALDPRTRLINIEAAVATGERSGAISSTEAAQLRLQHGDLARLEAAYGRSTPSADDSAYLARRLGELEVRARVVAR